MSMNYQKIYNNLIDKARARGKVSVYYETHHVIPKCQGGTDELNNLVDLTPEEHYVAHQLLAKAYPEHKGLLHAAVMMCVNRSNNKLYGWLRRRLSISQSKKMLSGGSPTYNKRWISNENETILVDKDVAEAKINNKTHIVGKKAIKAICGHVVKDRCLECENLKRKSYDKKIEESRALAISLFNEFKSSNIKSVCEFARIKNTTQPRLSILWKKYVIDYRNNRQHGKSFKK